MFVWWGNLLARYANPWPLLGFSFIVTFLALALLYQLANKAALLPGIRSRDVHQVRKPRVGGVAMWLAVIASFAWILLADHPAGSLDFGRPHILGMDRAVLGIIVGMGVILVMGLWDDIKGLAWYFQLAGQIVAALILIAAGVTVPLLRLPFDAQLHLGVLASDLFTLIWVMLMINVMNWFDGLDGLAGSIALTASAALFFVSLQVNLLSTATLSLIVVGVTAAFLCWNWYPSKLFMGTVGSQLLGFLLAVIAIISGGKVATAVLVMGMPVMDALIVIVRRLSAHQSPFVADQRHLHHRLLKIGLPVPWVVILINAVAIIFGILAVRNPESTAKGALGLVLVGCMVIFILVTYALELRVKKKVD